MGKNINKFEAITKKFEELRKELKSVGEKATKEALKEFFDANPEVTAVRWHQYTPYFNDGDTCTFSVGEPSVQLKSTKDTTEGDSEDGFIDSWSLNYCVPEELRESFKDARYGTPTYEKISKQRTWYPGASKELKKDLDDLYQLLQTAEEALQAAFGDHAEITATRKEVIVEEYEHE